MRIAKNILELVGRTPLVDLARLRPKGGARVVAKLEHFNPGGSVKDRIGIAMVEAAERAGQLRPGGTIVEPTSGNTGVGLALAATIRGYKLVCTVPAKVPKEKIALLEAYGAEVVVCPNVDDPDDPRAYYNVARRIEKERGAFRPDQYSNPANPGAHYATTGPEIWQDTDGKLTHFVAGMGTGGTISGTARFLKEQNPKVHVVGVDTDGSVLRDYFENGKVTTSPHQYLIDGIGEDFIPGATDFDVVDDVVTCSDRDAYATTLRLAREEGVFAGSSSGAAVWGALETARKAPADALVVVLSPDAGDRYLSKLNAKWLEEHGLVAPSVTKGA